MLTLGQEIEVIVEEIDEKGKVSLTPGAVVGGRVPPTATAASRFRSLRRGERPVAAAASGTRPPSGRVSFDDAFDAELAGELGDLGPGGEAGGGAADRAGDRGPRRDDRSGGRSRGRAVTADPTMAPLEALDD